MGNELFGREYKGVGLGLGEVEDDIATLKAKACRRFHSSGAEGPDKYESLGGTRALRFLNILKFLRFRIIERYPGFFRFFGFLLCTKDGT